METAPRMTFGGRGSGAFFYVFFRGGAERGNKNGEKGGKPNMRFLTKK